MSTRTRRPAGWKKELAALVVGLLLGSAWEAAHAAPDPVARAEARLAHLSAVVTSPPLPWHKRGR